MKDEYDINITPNKSRTYMLPFVDEQIGFKFIHNMINTYLSFEDGDDIFCVMYKWTSDLKFLKFEGELMKNHLFLGHEDYADHTIYKFRLSRHMQIGKEHFIKGDYHLFSPDHKGAIMCNLREIGATNADRIGQILSEIELLTSPPPDMNNETLSNHVKKINYEIEKFE